MDRSDVGFGECERFSSPFSVTFDGVAIFVEGHAEKFKGNAIKNNFLVVTDNSEDAVRRLIDIFESENMGECEVIKGSALAIGVDVMRKTVGRFKADGEVVANAYGQEGFDVVHE